MVDLWQSFIEAREQGLARDIGVSNFDAALIDEVTSATGAEALTAGLFDGDGVELAVEQAAGMASAANTSAARRTNLTGVVSLVE